MSNRYVLVAYEKHGDYFYDASDNEALGRSALEILTDRWNSGYFYYDPDELYPDDSKWSTSMKQLIPDWDEEASTEEKQEKIKDFRENVIGAVPDKDAQAVMMKKLKSAISRYKEKREYTKWYNDTKKIVETQDATRAWGVLNDRSDHEYERVELELLRGGKHDD